MTAIAKKAICGSVYLLTANTLNWFKRHHGGSGLKYGCHSGHCFVMLVWTEALEVRMGATLWILIEVLAGSYVRNNFWKTVIDLFVVLTTLSGNPSGKIQSRREVVCFKCWAISRDIWHGLTVCLVLETFIKNLETQFVEWKIAFYFVS